MVLENNTRCDICKRIFADLRVYRSVNRVQNAFMLSFDETVNTARERSLPSPEVRRFIREQSWLYQSDIAAALGVDRATVSRWETGAKEPRGEMRERYARLLQQLQREVLSQ